MTDPNRPTYHYSSGGWMNDVIPYAEGDRLHVMFNHHKEARFGRFRWGHAHTDDLLGWATEPYAIVPTRGGPDEAGVWTGSVVATPDGPAAFYTGITTFEPFTQVQCLARSSNTVTWHKHPAPVIAERPDGYGDCWRDPYTWWDGDRWRMLLGSAVRDRRTAAVLAYESDDVERWRFAGPLYIDDRGELGREAECPELFALGDRHVLVTSCGTTKALVGSLADDGRFLPEGPAAAFDPATSYAARSVEVGGRRIQLAWLRDTRSQSANRAAGWAGALSLPRELSLGRHGRVTVAPVAELVGLRIEQLHDGPVAAPREVGGVRLVPGCAGDAVEVDAALEPVPGGSSGLVLGCDDRGDGGVELTVDWAAGTVAGYDLGPLPDDEPLRVRTFVDASVVEAFVLGRVVTLRGYDLPAARRAAVRGPAQVTAWRLAAPPGAHNVGTPGVVTAR